MLPASPDTCLGVDLGQSKTCVAADVAGVPRLLPDAAGQTLIQSLVAFAPDGSVFVGADAKRQRQIEPANVVGCDLRPDAAAVSTRAGAITPAQVSSILLDYARRIAGAALRTDSRRVILTLPAALSAERRDDVIAGAAMAGLAVEVILTSPAAAATAYGFDERPPVPLVVWDLGGGKFECTILEMRNRQPVVLATASDPFLGGAEMDRRIVAGMLEAFRDVHQVDLSRDAIAIARLLTAAEEAKVALGSHEAVTITVPAIAQSIYGQPLDLKLALARAVFAGRVVDLMARAATLATEALRQASLPRERIGEILLVGGMMRLPPLQEKVTALFGRPGRLDIPPEEACALGAARWAAREQASLRRQTSPYGGGFAGLAGGPGALGAEIGGSGQRTRMGRISTKKMFTAVMQAPTVSFSPSRLTPPPIADQPPPTMMESPAPVAQPPPLVQPPTVMQQPILTEVTAARLAISTVGGFCDPIIPADTPLPASFTRVFATGRDGQQVVQVSVCQGESRRFAENTALGTVVLDGLPARPRGQVRIAVTFAIDGDGVLEASARDEQSGRAQSIRIKLDGG